MHDRHHDVRPVLTAYWLMFGVVFLLSGLLVTAKFGLETGAITAAALVLLVAGPLALYYQRARIERVGRTVILHKALGRDQTIDCRDVAEAGVYTLKDGTAPTKDQRLLVRFRSGAPSLMMRGLQSWNVRQLQWLFAGGGVDLADVPGVRSKTELAEHFPGAF